MRKKCNTKFFGATPPWGSKMGKRVFKILAPNTFGAATRVRVDPITPKAFQLSAILLATFMPIFRFLDPPGGSKLRF